MESTELRYVDLKNYICRQIYEGVYQDGEKIPSERQMAADYEVSRITVRKALELLEEEELIVREVGNGTTVTLKNHGNETATDMIARFLHILLPSSSAVSGSMTLCFCMWRRRSIRRWRIACTGFTAKISAMLSYGRMTGAWIRKSFCVSGASA